SPGRCCRWAAYRHRRVPRASSNHWSRRKYLRTASDHPCLHPPRASPHTVNVAFETVPPAAHSVQRKRLTVRVGIPRSRNKDHRWRDLASLSERDVMRDESFQVDDTRTKWLTTQVLLAISS